MMEGGFKFNIQAREKSSKDTAEKMGNLMAEIMNEADKIEVRAEDRNEKNELLVSPEGTVSNLGKQSELWWKIARTESFKKFFGDWQNQTNEFSKILDKNGEPLVLFRGVGNDITLEQFYDNESEHYNRKYYELGKGIYFTPDHSVSEDIGGGSIFPAFVNVRKPKYTEDSLGDMLEDVKDFIELKIPKNLLKNLPRITFTNYDAAFKEKEKGVPLEEVYEVLIKNVNQILIIPSLKKTN